MTAREPIVDPVNVGIRKAGLGSIAVIGRIGSRSGIVFGIIDESRLTVNAKIFGDVIQTIIILMEKAIVR